jgi:hypothetical protein
MGTNNLAPTGFSFARNFISSAATYAMTQMSILNGYPSNIMVGDPVILNANGTVNIAGSATFGTVNTGPLGIFAGVLPYYDTTQQATSHGLNGAYLSTAAPPSGVNIPCMVITDPFATFIAQLNGVAFLQSWVGMNCTWLQSTVGQNTAGNGRSVAALDNTTNPIGTSITYPLRIIGPAGVSGGPQDPANANPWIEVRLNLSTALATLGV